MACLFFFADSREFIWFRAFSTVGIGEFSDDRPEVTQLIHLPWHHSFHDDVPEIGCRNLFVPRIVNVRNEERADREESGVMGGKCQRKWHVTVGRVCINILVEC